jgi:nucleoside-diphosphate-sugar epimerase
MRVLVTGGEGYLGRKLVNALVGRGELVGPSGTTEPIDHILLTDMAPATAAPLADSRLSYLGGDIADPAFVENLFAEPPQAIFHLAALMSGGAEKAFEAGYKANLHGTLHLLEAARRAGNVPRFVFTSTIATFGGELPDLVLDTQRQTPQSSYGTQKVIGELLVSDYTRRGFIDGRSLRLPIIAVRGGAPSTATSAWASDIVREPLLGHAYASPVLPTDRGYLLSPRRAIEGLIIGHESAAERWGGDRSVMMAGLACSAADLVAAVGRQGGSAAAELVEWTPDPFIRDIVTTWPTAFRLDKATRIGLAPDASVDEIVRNYIEDDAPTA